MQNVFLRVARLGGIMLSRTPAGSARQPLVDISLVKIIVPKTGKPDSNP